MKFQSGYNPKLRLLDETPAKVDRQERGTRKPSMKVWMKLITLMNHSEKPTERLQSSGSSGSSDIHREDSVQPVSNTRKNKVFHQVHRVCEMFSKGVVQ